MMMMMMMTNFGKTTEIETKFDAVAFPVICIYTNFKKYAKCIFRHVVRKPSRGRMFVTFGIRGEAADIIIHTNFLAKRLRVTKS